MRELIFISVLTSSAASAQTPFFQRHLDDRAAEAPIVLDSSFEDSFDDPDRPGTCPLVNEAKQALARPDAGTLAGVKAAFAIRSADKSAGAAEGPAGSGRYVTVTLAVASDAGIVGTCIHETTIGHRNAHRVQEHFGAWNPLVGNRFTMWVTTSVNEDGDFGWVLVPRVYTLENGALLIDRRATAAEVKRFGAAYAKCKDCRELQFASKEFEAWAKKVEAEPKPDVITVPDAIRAINVPLELSGLRWFAPMERYLAVSDDTGLEGNKRRGFSPAAPPAHKGAPYLFTMSKSGVIDDQPIILEGVERVDDLESITTAAPGEFFAVTSHSLTRKGKSRAERKQLLRIQRSEDGKFAVKESLDLDALGLTKLAGGQLDVEAVEWRAKVLYLGLKAPLDPKGRAQIITLDLETKTFVKWASVELVVNGIKQGVTDLLFLPDGRLLLVSNQPKQPDMTDFGGALWRLDKPDAAPVLIQHFPGLKPEGLSFTPDGKKLKVVFDRGPGVPQWLEVALPPPTASPPRALP
ncbi:MAG: hypothetical protein JNM17_00660 [Archangium sp.]|nr:hypothetical protein [Archangium sp.]